MSPSFFQWANELDLDKYTRKLENNDFKQWEIVKEADQSKYPLIPLKKEDDIIIYTEPKL